MDDMNYDHQYTENEQSRMSALNLKWCVGFNFMLNDGLRCVLRIYSNGGAQRESYVMSLVSDLVPVPQELHRGDNWSIFSFIDGDLLESVP